MLRIAALKKHQLIAHTVRDGEKKSLYKDSQTYYIVFVVGGKQNVERRFFCSLEMHSQSAVYMEMNRWLAPQRYGKYGQSDD